MGREGREKRKGEQSQGTVSRVRARWARRPPRLTSIQPPSQFRGGMGDSLCGQGVLPPLRPSQSSPGFPAGLGPPLRGPSQRGTPTSVQGTCPSFKALILALELPQNPEYRSCIEDSCTPSPR